MWIVVLQDFTACTYRKQHAFVTLAPLCRVQENPEIVDLASETSVCRNKLIFPVPVYGAHGGVALDGHPIVCGGRSAQSYLSDCFSYVSGDWRKSSHRDRCYDFLNIFAEKFSEKIGVFCSNYC
jgi:hypothetical protein